MKTRIRQFLTFIATSALCCTTAMAQSPGTDVTATYIVNPSYETDGVVSNGGTITGWTVSPQNDTGVFSPTDGKHTTIGYTGNYIINNWWNGSPVTQNIGVLPEGAYILSADVATGNDAATLGTLYLNAQVGTTNYISTGYVSSNNQVLGTERLTFYSDGVSTTTIGLRGGEDAVRNSDGTVTKGAYNASGYWWYKADNFRLTYIGKTNAELAAWLTATATSNAPYGDVTDITDYSTNHATYSAYTSSNTLGELITAIDYLTNEYDDYLWYNASVSHPVDVTSYTISGAECTSNDEWPGSGRTTATGTYYDGSNRTYFTQNHESGPARSQSVTVRYEGAYMLRTIVRPRAAASYATISIGDETTTVRGVPAGADNIGNGWTYNDVFYAQNEINQTRTISISLSNVNSSREADCGEMHLYYIGRNADYVSSGIRKYIGIYDSAPVIEVTDETPIANTTAASMTGATVTFTNPNGLVFANSGQVTAAKNVVAGGTCENLVLTDGHPFVNPTSFIATSAQYTLSALAGGAYATLMLPFAASTLPGAAYQLDQDIDLIHGSLYATAVTAIQPNAPVVVTATGQYGGTGTSVPAVSQGATFTNGQLIGVYQSQSVPSGAYALQNHTTGEGVAFYPVGDVQPTVNPFRAYIKQQSNEAKSLRILFDTPTAIEHAAGSESAIGPTVFYNIAGQLVAPEYKGIVIDNNGNKYLRK